MLVHLHFGLQEMLLGTLSTTDAAADTDAASYWREAPADGADALDQVQFARSIASAYRPPTGLMRHVCITADALNRAVAGLDAGTVRFQGRLLPTGDFLATWAVELAVHHLDLDRELDLAPPAPAALIWRARRWRHSQAALARELVGRRRPFWPGRAGCRSPTSGAARSGNSAIGSRRCDR